MSSLPVTNPQERQVSAVMSWRERYRTHLASKESKTGLPWEAQSSSMEVLMRPRGRVAQAEDAV